MKKKPHHTALRELKYINQVPGEPLRRMFSCSRMDIYVWIEESGEIYGFQLCYRHTRQEKALTWMRDKGFTHRNVDDGENADGPFKMTPLLVPDGEFAKAEVIASFEEINEKVEPEIAEFIQGKLDEYENDNTE